MGLSRPVQSGRGGPDAAAPDVPTAAPAEVLVPLLHKLGSVPAGFTLMRQMRPWDLSRRGSRKSTSPCWMIGLYQSAMYRQPSGPNSILTGRNQSSLEVRKSGRCVPVTLPSSLRVILTQLMAEVMGLGEPQAISGKLQAGVQE